MKKKIIFRSLIGAPIGVTISLIITIIFSLCLGQGEHFRLGPRQRNDSRNFAACMLACCGRGFRRLVRNLGN